MTITPANTTRIACSPEEWHCRVQLAAAYQLAYRFGFADIVWNHITAKVPNSNCFLINRFGLRFDEVTASSLVRIDGDGKVIDAGIVTDKSEHLSAVDDDKINTTGFIIHSGIHAAHDDIQCIMHAHTDAGMAVSVLDGGLEPMMLDAMVFYNRIAYHQFDGAAIDISERDALVKSLGNHRAMILKHHGLMTCGESVEEAFIKMFYLERACRVQIAVQSSGQPYSLPDDVTREKTAKEYLHFPHGRYEWPALLRLLDQQQSNYAT